MNHEIVSFDRFTRFEVGKTYWCRSLCDYDTIFEMTVVKRTAKTITTDEGKTLRIFTVMDGTVEQVRPHGNYSMAPIMSAERFWNEEAAQAEEN